MTVDSIYLELKKRLADVMPDFELRAKAEVAWEIEQLKRDRNAVILAHNYMEPALFLSVPDIRGDSLELARRAADLEQEVIVFCGVRFMAETAKNSQPGENSSPAFAGGRLFVGSQHYGGGRPPHSARILRCASSLLRQHLRRCEG